MVQEFLDDVSNAIEEDLDEEQLSSEQLMDKIEQLEVSKGSGRLTTVVIGTCYNCRSVYSVTLRTACNVCTLCNNFIKT